MSEPIVYGSWTVLEGGVNTLYWKCQCACGVIKDVNKKNLKSGSSKSCTACRDAKRKTHGYASRKGANNSTYRSWQSMIDRCRNPNSPRWDDYGGREIKVCEQWQGPEGFKTFLADMGERPSLEHSIDRFPNNDGNYEPGNCRWATKSEQQRNKRTTVFIPFDGRSLCPSDWAEEFGMTEKTFSTRRSRGWSMEEIRDTPVGPRRGNTMLPAKPQQEGGAK